MFSLEREMLERRGHQVQVFTRHSDELANRGLGGAVAGAVSTPWNPFSFSRLQERIASFGPDVVHAHNTFPLLSPAVFPAAKGTPRVLALHNYRLFCAAAVPMRGGRVCTDCLDRRSVVPALRHGCYRCSRVATLPLAASIALHRFRGTWNRDVEAFIVPSAFQRDRLVDAGLPRDRIHVKPNFCSGDPVPVPWRERANQVVFVGRLSAEKGVRTLLRAWALWGVRAPALRIVGDGELRGELEAMARDLPVELVGQLTPEEAQAEIGRARLLVLPAEGFETFGLAVTEGFARGTPAAVTHIGPLPDLVRESESGCVFEPGNPESLLSAVQSAWENPALLERWGQGARAAFEAKYTEDTNYAMLMQIYEQAIERAERAKHAR